MRLLQVAKNDVVNINDALRQVRDAFDEAMPAGALILFPDGRALPLGWGLADGANGRPDLRAHGVAGHVYIVRLV